MSIYRHDTINRKTFVAILMNDKTTTALQKCKCFYGNIVYCCMIVDCHHDDVNYSLCFGLKFKFKYYKHGIKLNGDFP